MHVNSSFPRSGSELMQALLGQHPRVYASATSPLLEYWFAASKNLNLPEVKSQDEQKMKEAFKSFCRSGAVGYYQELTNKDVIVDKSRGWIEYADFLWDIFPDAKIVSMVRSIDDIVNSLERVYRANPMHPEMDGLPKTPEQRAAFWCQSGSLPLGLALDRFKGRAARGDDPRILHVDYDLLIQNPIEVMKQTFEHLNIEPIEIDPNNVVKSAEEDDSHYGIFGSHQLRSTVGKR